MVDVDQRARWLVVRCAASDRTENGQSRPSCRRDLGCGEYQRLATSFESDLRVRFTTQCHSRQARSIAENGRCARQGDSPVASLAKNLYSRSWAARVRHRNRNHAAITRPFEQSYYDGALLRFSRRLPTTHGVSMGRSARSDAAHAFLIRIESWPSASLPTSVFLKFPISGQARRLLCLSLKSVELPAESRPQHAACDCLGEGSQAAPKTTANNAAVGRLTIACCDSAGSSTDLLLRVLSRSIAL